MLNGFTTNSGSQIVRRVTKWGGFGFRRGGGGNGDGGRRESLVDWRERCRWWTFYGGRLVTLGNLLQEQSSSLLFRDLSFIIWRYSEALVAHFFFFSSGWTIFIVKYQLISSICKRAPSRLSSTLLPYVRERAVANCKWDSSAKWFVECEKTQKTAPYLIIFWRKVLKTSY